MRPESRRDSGNACRASESRAGRIRRGLAVTASVGTAPTKDLLAALNTSAGLPAVLDDGKSGGTYFRVQAAAPLAALIAADTRRGIYVPSTFDTSKVWVRQYRGRALIDWFDPVGDGVANDTAPLVAALSVSPLGIQLGIGTYAFDLSALPQLASGQAIVGYGKTQSILKVIPLAAGVDQTTTATTIITAPGATDIELRDFTLDVSKSGYGRGVLNRCQGITLRTGGPAYVDNVKVRNCTAYSFWNKGDDVSGTYFAPAVLIGCESENAQVHFEEVYAKGVRIISPQWSAGDGDIDCEAIYHQYGGGTDEITMIGGRAKDNVAINAGAGWLVLTSLGDMGKISIVDTDMEVSGATLALSCPDDGNVEELSVISSTLYSPGNTGAQVKNCARLNIAAGSRVEGLGRGVSALGTTMVFGSGSHSIGNGNSVTHAYGIVADTGTQVSWAGGALIGVDNGAGASAFGGYGQVWVSPATEVSPDPGYLDFSTGVRVPANKALIARGPGTIQVSVSYDVGGYGLLQAIAPGIALEEFKINALPLVLQWSFIDIVEIDQLGPNLKSAAYGYSVAGNKIIGQRAPAIASPTGGTVIDVECRNALSSLLNVLRASTGPHGLISG